jgi:hypothetical protein
VITRRDAHHTIVTALECKEWSRKVDAPVVDAFATKCADTGVHERIIVSSSGFTKGARLKAEGKNIICMELSEAETFDWMENNVIHHVGRLLVHTLAEVMFEGDADPPAPMTVFTTGGDEMTPQHFDRMGLEALHTKFPNDQGGDGLRHVLVETPGWYAVAADGERYLIKFIGLELTVKFGRRTAKFDLHTYTGPNARYGIASADVNVGPISAKLMMIEHGEGTTVMWVTDPKPEPVGASSN